MQVNGYLNIQKRFNCILRTGFIQVTQVTQVLNMQIAVNLLNSQHVTQTG